MKPISISSRAWVWFVLGLLFIFPLVNGNNYHRDVMVTAGIFMILALGLNVIVGYAGILNLGYAAFYAVGAYTYALVNIHFHMPFWAGIWVSGAAGALFGMLLAWPALRLGGDYLAIVTLGAGEIVRIALNNVDEVTGGPNGLLGIQHPTLWFPKMNFGVKPLPYYYLVFAIVGILVFMLRRLESSRLGRSWVALREDELAASCMGINPMWAKLSSFGIGGFIAGIAGCIFASKQGTVSPDSFDFILSVMVLAMVVLGGLGNIEGVLIGAFMLSILPELLRGFEIYRMLLFGVAMILIMLFRPQGLLGESRHVEEFRRKKEKAPA
ncbi:MAG TPA: branched-chain amino acid ABC transporter permease [Verrucomicrobiae bacterium]|jgi:branched-chain amino acid transport system permease protein|nr:branched-chain amino acid ABC transporter permease [Verrucomicrobiae bacterium]